ncbi:MAG: hypothetical protein AMXMBFR7_53080 [Planctomycetota bacterium]
MARRPRRKLRADEDLVRFGVSIPKGLSREFDEFLVNHENLNRSEGIRDLIRERLTQKAWTAGKADQVATLTLLVEVKNPELPRRLADARRELADLLLSATQIRLSEKEELHVYVLRGTGTRLQEQVDRLLALRGVLGGKLAVVGGTGR